MDLVTTRGMVRFRCIGGDCEDTCCKGWKIPVDKEHHDLLRARLDPAEMAASFKPFPDGNDQRYALLVMDDHGACAFLDGGGLCTVHTRFGEGLLPDTCAMYPRLIGRVDERYELGGSISCPEVARLYLLSDDALEPARATFEMYARGEVSAKVDAGSEDLFDRSFPAVRALALDLLGQRRYPLASRVFFLVALADRTREQLRTGAPLAGAPVLQAVGRALQSPATLDELDRQARELEIEGPFGVSVVRTLLRLPPQLVPPNLQRLFGGVAKFYDARGAPVDADLAAFEAAYRALPPLAPELEARLEVLLERFATQHVAVNFYVKRETFVGYVHDMCARIALARFLIRTQVAMIDDAVSVDMLDALAVRAIYLIARQLEHNAELVRKLVGSLEAGQMTPAHALSLLRV